MRAIARVLALLPAVHFAVAAPPVFRNHAAQYVGSKQCAACHRPIYDRFVKSAMGRSVTRPGPELLAAPVRVANPKFQREYTVTRAGGELFQTEAQQRDGQAVFEVKHKLEFAIGSGANGISFVVKRGDHLFQAPISYYSAAKRWDLSPGYEETGEGFNRPIYEACIVCHAGRPRAVPRRDGLYLDPPFAELAIGCENCHGPGQLHVAERSTAGRAALPDTSIVNPRHLPARLAEDICMQCHQGGDARVLLPGKSYADFRPGAPLIDTLAIFSLPLEGKNADLLEHHTSMKLSACYRAANGKLGCLTCHDPHEQPTAAAAPAYFRAKCVSCHPASRGCKLDAVARRNTKPADNCIACHMPKRSVERISHSALTNHRIPARAGDANSAIAAMPSTVPGLLVVNGPDARLPLATRLAAYGELMTRAPELQPRYTELLDEAAREGSDDPAALMALGHHALTQSSAGAATLLEQAERKGASGPIFYLDLAEALARAGRADDSTAALERGELAFPFSPAIRKRVVLEYIRRKAYGKAKAALERYVHDFPEDEFMRGLLAQAPK